MAHYPDEFINRLHLIWGSGFLSPGGPQEVREIVRGIDLQNALVLDIGCGTGGPAIVLANEMSACVVGIDVEPQLIDHARHHAEQAGAGDRIEFRLVEPGSLPFAAEMFDVVFSKDALIHIADKRALYSDILRVLKPGGVFAASDWLSGENAAGDVALQRYVESAQLGFAMATAGETAQIMRTVGFANVETTDRNRWFADVAAKEVAEIEGPLHEQIIEVSNLETYEQWLVIRRHQAEAARTGGLRPTHLRGRRPSTAE